MSGQLFGKRSVVVVGATHSLTTPPGALMASEGLDINPVVREKTFSAKSQGQQSQGIGSLKGRNAATVPLR